MVNFLRRSRYHHTIGIGLFMLLPFALLFWLVYREREVLLSYPWQFQGEFLVGSFVLFSAALALAAILWADIMRVLGSGISFHDHIRYFCLSHLARRLPGTIWYVIGRGYLYRQQNEPIRRVTIASSVELVLMVLAGVLVSLAFSAQWLVSPTQIYFYSFLSILLLGIGLSHPRTGGWLFRRLGLSTRPRLGYAAIVRWLTGYVVIWLLGGLVFFLLANVVVPVERHHLPFFLGVWAVVGVSSMLVFFLPTNLGFSELGLSLFVSTILPTALAISLALLTRIAMTLYEIILVGFVLLGYVLGSFNQQDAEGDETAKVVVEPSLYE